VAAVVSVLQRNWLIALAAAALLVMQVIQLR
jgi:hypothetical protein